MALGMPGIWRENDTLLHARQSSNHDNWAAMGNISRRPSTGASAALKFILQRDYNYTAHNLLTGVYRGCKGGVYYNVWDFP